MNPICPIQELTDPDFAGNQLRVLVLRLDKIPLTPGNKYFKLKYNLEAFLQSGRKYLVTVGGAWSNHLAATAAAGKVQGIATIGLVRGDELHAASNGILEEAEACGMRLFFLSRRLYRKRNDADFAEAVCAAHPSLPPPEAWWYLPEGGTNEHAVRGCSEILESVQEHFDTVVCACGTGGTLAGITSSLSESRHALGIDVTGRDPGMEKRILSLNGERKNFRLIPALPRGRYAQPHPELTSFCRIFSLPAEPVYTGRMFFTLRALVAENNFRKGSVLLALHTGGQTLYQ